MKKNEIKVLSDIEHVLLRPGLYIGSNKPVSVKQYFFHRENDRFEYDELTYIPALLKIVREVIDNSIDEGIRTNWKFANRIKVTIDKNQRITIEDNGRGIPHQSTTKGQTGPELAWCNLRAGSNFNDEKGNTTLGQNGVGVSLTHIFSKAFKGESCDGIKKVTVDSKNNMADKKVSITKGTKKFTRVSFVPDYERFGVTEFDELHQRILFSDLINLTQIYPKLEIVFNGKEKIINYGFKKYAEFYGPNVETIETDGLKIAIFPNQYDDFNFYHNINGLNVISGGNPLDWVMNSVLKPLTDKLVKKYKSLKIGDVKNKVSAVVLFTKMSNPRFNSQTKENCMNRYTDFKDDIGEIDFEKFANNRLYKNKELLSPIVDVFRIKEELEARKALKDLKPETKKRVVIEKYLPSVKNNKYLVLAEGDSASSRLSGVIGRDDYGHFPLKGKPLNILEVKPKKISESDIIRDILQILNLDITNPNKQKLKYEKIMIATDADADGSHIAGLIILFFQKYAPYVIEEGNLCLFRTPLVVAKKGDKVQHAFFDFKEYNRFKNENEKAKGLTYKYYKGLGTWKKEDLVGIIRKEGMESFIIPFEAPENIDEILENWFSKDTSDLRKDFIKDNKFDIEAV